MFTITTRETDGNKMMITDNQTKLQRKGIAISVPPEVKARRTIFARRILPHVGNKTAEELKTEIELQQHWAKINCVTKIKDYTHIIQIVL